MRIIEATLKENTRLKGYAKYAKATLDNGMVIDVYLGENLKDAEKKLKTLVGKIIGYSANFTGEDYDVNLKLNSKLTRDEAIEHARLEAIKELESKIKLANNKIVGYESDNAY